MFKKVFVLLFTISSFCLGQENKLDNQKISIASIAESQIHIWLSTWQTILQLNSWKIEINIVRVDELRPKTLGNIHWNIETKSALIKVLHPDDYKCGTYNILKDMEYTVVHELVHLSFVLLPKNPNIVGEEEIIVNNISNALISLERKTEILNQNGTK